MAGKVYIIGAGPGDPELLTLKGKRIMAGADVIIYAGSLVNKAILGFASKNAVLIDSAQMALDAITAHMVKAVKQGRVVVRLHSGDPSLFGAIAEQIDALKKKRISCNIIPGVSSAFAAAAALKIEYTLPEVTQTLIVTRISGRTPVPESEAIRKLAASHASMAIFLSIDRVEEVVRELLAGGYTLETPAAVVYRASWPDEKRITGTLETIASQVKRKKIGRQALILIGQAVGRKKNGSIPPLCT